MSYRNRIRAVDNGRLDESRYLTVESLHGERCIVDLSGLREVGDQGMYRLPCRMQALRDIAEGRQRHFHDGDDHGTFERVDDVVEVAFHHGEPQKAMIRADELEEVIRLLEARRDAQRPS